MKNYYDMLGVSENASDKEIKQSFKYYLVVLKENINQRKLN